MNELAVIQLPELPALIVCSGKPPSSFPRILRRQHPQSEHQRRVRPRRAFLPDAIVAPTVLMASNDWQGTTWKGTLNPDTIPLQHRPLEGFERICA
jgi:hypothetical protein